MKLVFNEIILFFDFTFIHMVEEKQVIRIYNISYREASDPYEPECYWWISSKYYQTIYGQHLLLED